MSVVKEPLYVLSAVVLFGIIVAAIMFRYQYFSGVQIRVDRWTGCAEAIDEAGYKPITESCK